MKNFMPGHYRGVSVGTFDIPLDAHNLGSLLVGREAYGKTEYLVARRENETAVLRVTTAPGTELFLPIVRVEILATPDECAFVHAPQVDTGIPTQMAKAALDLAPGARCVVVHGLYEHVNFILDPAPIPVRVVDVAPPWPPKLADQAKRVLQTAEGLPPIDLQLHVTDLVALAADHPSERYLYPCRGSGAAPAGAQVSYLDERPPLQDWTLVGCARSREIHSWIYGSKPPFVELCPRKLAGVADALPHQATGLIPTAGAEGVATLTKCCLLETGIEQSGLQVTVPWGASLAEVHEGLRALVTAADPAWAPA
jgi:hypothetical protein